MQSPCPWTGPVGVACWTDSLDIADLVQLDFGYAAGYQHCPIVTTKYGTEGNQIFCAAHSSDCFDRPLNDFPAYTNIRFAHLTGYYD